MEIENLECALEVQLRVVREFRDNHAVRCLVGAGFIIVFSALPRQFVVVCFIGQCFGKTQIGGLQLRVFGSMLSYLARARARARALKAFASARV